MDERDGHATRRLILTVVDQARAIHKSELCRNVDRAWGTVGHHLRQLGAEGLVATERHGGILWVFPGRLQKWERKEARILAEESSRTVLAAVEEQPDITVNDLDAFLDLPIKTIRRHLSQLQDVGLIRRDGRSPQRFIGVQFRRRR